MIGWSSPAYTEDESQTATLTLVRSGSTAGTDSVQFSTANGTAMGGTSCSPGIDYITVTNQTVTFNPGDTTATVTVTICGDLLTEAAETIDLSATGPGTFAYTDAANAVLNINDTATAYRNPATICTNLGGPADVYPSQIAVTNGPSAIGSMRVTLYDLYHVFPDHLDMLLVGPGGQKFVIQGDAGGAFPVDTTAPVTLSYKDGAGAVLPDVGQLVTGQFEPTNWESPVTEFPVPAPLGPYSEPGSTVGGTGTETFAGNFGLTNSNGTWSLYLRDDAGNPAAAVLTGCAAGGWGIEFFASTAAGVDLTGRVVNEIGQGVLNAVVTATDQNGHVRTIRTGSFGYFRFADLNAGDTYLVSVSSKRYGFSPQIVHLVDNTDILFVAH